MKAIKINVLGTPYTIKFLKVDQDAKLETLDGYCDNTSKEIVIALVDDDVKNVKHIDIHYDHVIKHELVHAFLYESGLMGATGWADNETIVDWIANQHDKLEQTISNVRLNVNAKTKM